MCYPFSTILTLTLTLCYNGSNPNPNPNPNPVLKGDVYAKWVTFMLLW